MTKQYCEEMIAKLTSYWNMATNIIDRDEINSLIKKYKSILNELSVPEPS